MGGWLFPGLGPHELSLQSQPGQRGLGSAQVAGDPSLSHPSLATEESCPGEAGEDTVRAGEEGQCDTRGPRLCRRLWQIF